MMQAGLSVLISMGGQLAVWFSLCLLLILLIRKPFARRFGPKATYWLWRLPPLQAASILLGLMLSAAMSQATVQTAIDTRETSQKEITIDALHAVRLVNETPSTNNASTQRLSSWPETHQNIGYLCLALVWLTGVAVFLMRLHRSQVRFQQDAYLDSSPASTSLNKQVYDIAQTLRLPCIPSVRQSVFQQSPMVVKAKETLIIVPTGFETLYSDQEQYHALLHELMHVKRHDLGHYQIALFCAALQWFNPLSYRALEAFRTDQESACDADILAHQGASAPVYASTLLKAVQLAQGSTINTKTVALALSHPLKDRLLHIKHSRKTYKHAKAGLAMLLLIVCSAPVTTAAFTEITQKTRLSRAENTVASHTRTVSVEGIDHIVCATGISVNYSHAATPKLVASLTGANWDDVQLRVNQGQLTASWADSLSPAARKTAALNLIVSSPAIETIDVSQGASFTGEVSTNVLNVNAAPGAYVSLKGHCSALTINAATGVSIDAEDINCDYIVMTDA